MACPRVASERNTRPMNSRLFATCPQCNAQLAVGRENAGKRIRCPKCQSAVQVSNGEVAAPSPTVEVDTVPADCSTGDRIAATCPKCSASLAVGLEKSGKQLRCPKCQAPVQVPDRNGDVNPPPPQIGTLWNVAVGKKKIGPFGKAKLRALVDAEKLSGTAFVRDVPGEADWSEVQTVPWLFDFPEHSHFRYCPECDCRVIVANSPQSDDLGALTTSLGRWSSPQFSSKLYPTRKNASVTRKRKRSQLLRRRRFRDRRLYCRESTNRCSNM